MFLDSDDKMLNNMVEKMHNKIDEVNADVVRCMYLKNGVKCDEDWEEAEYTNETIDEFISSQIVTEKMPCYVWCLIVKKDLIHGFNTKLLMYEDVCVYLNLFKEAKKIYFYKEYLYDYNRNRSDSLSIFDSEEKLFRTFEGKNEILKILENHGLRNTENESKFESRIFTATMYCLYAVSYKKRGYSGMKKFYGDLKNNEYFENTRKMYNPKYVSKINRVLNGLVYKELWPVFGMMCFARMCLRRIRKQEVRMGRNFVEGYFRKNLGDDLFVKVLAQKYPDVEFDVNVDSEYLKIWNAPNLHVVKKYTVSNIVRKIKSIITKKKSMPWSQKCYERVIRVGGSWFMEQSIDDIEEYKRTFLDKSKKNYIIGANFGPYQTEEFLKLHKEDLFVGVEDICFRDKYSYELFKDLPNVRYAPDVIFGLDVSNVKIVDNSKNVVFSIINCNKDNMKVNQDLYNEKIMEMIKFYAQKGYSITLMSFLGDERPESYSEEIIIDEMIEKINKEKAKAEAEAEVGVRANEEEWLKNIKIDKYFYKGNIEEALDVLGNAEIIVGTRFHANVLGMLLGKKVIPIAYGTKTINLLKDMNFQGTYFELDKLDTWKILRPQSLIS